jgi:RNA polymerase sigma-70 factor (ECF subfamily)
MRDNGRVGASPDEPDDALLQAWRAGDRDAGTRLVRRYFARVFAFFHARIPEQAEDLAQRTFLACMEGEGLRRVGSFRAYLFGIARHQLLRVFEKNEIVRRRGAVREPTITIETPTGAVVRGEEQRLLLRALRKLPLDQQILLELFYWERLSTAEIAVVMELSRSAVKVRLLRTRARLREVIETIDAPPDLRTQTLDNLDAWAAALAARRRS